jgi:sortase B
MGTPSSKSRKVKKAVVFVKSMRLIVLLFAATLILGLIVGTIRNRMVADEPSSDIFSEGDDMDDNPTQSLASMSDSVRKKIEEDSSPSDEDVLSVYRSIKEQNKEFIGYLTIRDTKINYPVMYSEDEPEKYLKMDINEVESIAGLPFVDARCSMDPESDNVIIYGHNMKDGSMFGELDAYKDKDYFEKHPVIRFDTTGELREYEVMAAFYDRIYYKDEGDYRFYDFINAASEDDYNENVNKYLSKSVYDTGVRAGYGDKLITLVTCAYHDDNGRFVVVAKRKDG